jgi:hypothetical protein
MFGKLEILCSNYNHQYCFNYTISAICFSDLKVVDEVRQQIPVFGQRRTDLYDTVRRD